MDKSYRRNSCLISSSHDRDAERAKETIQSPGQQFAMDKWKTPRNLSRFRGHCWRAALLAVFRLIVVVVVSGCKSALRQMAAMSLHRSREYWLPETQIARPLLCQRKERMLLMRGGSRDEPLQNSIEICFFFGTDTIAGYLTVGHALQIQ